MTPFELKRRRERAGLSQAQLAALLDVHPNTVAKWEQGAQPMRMPTLLRWMLNEIDGLMVQHGHDFSAVLAAWRNGPVD